MATMIELTEETAMSKTVAISCAFVDIGGVLLTNGWDRHVRERVAADFNPDWAEMESRHLLNFSVYEEGKLTLEEYLNRVVFYPKRPFTLTQFRDFMYAQSKPYPDMIEPVSELNIRHGLKIVVISNGGRELNKYRIQKFKLNSFVDAFIASCFVHVRKPGANIFRLAPDIAQVQALHTIYLENTPLFAQVAENLGIRSILHTDYLSTSTQLASLGLLNDKVGIP